MRPIRLTSWSSRTVTQLAAVAAAGLVAAAPCRAQATTAGQTTFSFSFSGTELFDPMLPLSGSGLLTVIPTTTANGPAYLVTGISGTVIGNADTPGGAITGLLPADTTTYNQNLLYYGGNGPLLDQPGLGFTVGTQSFDLYYLTSGGYRAITPLGEGTLYELGSFTVTPLTDPPASTVPEPATFVLFGAGLAGVAGVRRRAGRTRRGVTATPCS